MSGRPSNQPQVTFTLLDKGLKTKTEAVLTIGNLRGANKLYWRAILSVRGEDDRTFGVRKPTAVDAAEHLLKRFPDRIPESKRRQVLKILQGKFSSNVGEQPGQVPRTVGAQPGRPGYVPFIHQIYGLCRKRTCIPPQFEKSQLRWRQVAKGMGVIYHLWCADEVEALIKKEYNEFWTTYARCRYAGMRVNIARLAILHFYGGLHAGLSIFPNKDTFDETALAVQQNSCDGLHSQNVHGCECDMLGMEICASTPGNEFLKNCLYYIRRSIGERSVFGMSPGLYISTSTGERCMNIFLRATDNAEVLRTVKFLTCKTACHKKVTKAKNASFDVLQKESVSIADESEAINSRVGGRALCRFSLAHRPIRKSAVASLAKGN